VITIFEQILPGDPVVTVVIELPKSAVQDVEVLVREVSSDLIVVLLLIDQLEGLDEVRATYLPRSDASIVTSIDGIEDASD